MSDGYSPLSDDALLSGQSSPPVTGRPGWATAIGVIGIVWAVLGCMGSCSTAVMPSIIKIASSQHAGAKAGASSRESATATVPAGAAEAPPELKPDEIFSRSGVILAVLAFLVSVGMMVASIRLLLFSRGAPVLFMSVMGADMVLIAAKATVLASGSGRTGVIMAVATTVFSFIIDLVMLVVVLVCSKSSRRSSGDSLPVVN